MHTQAPSATQSKREGDISDAFASMSGLEATPLPERFLDLKRKLIRGNEDAVVASWDRLLQQLRIENDIMAREGPNAVPVVDFRSLDSDLAVLGSEIKKRGVAIVQGVISEEEARGYKSEIEDYIKQNPSTRAFPQDNPQVWELYWSAPQLKARSHPNLLKAQKALMSFWHLSNPESPISLTQPLAYADRLRIRQPGDAKFALGPHIDGGSVERWEENGYGLGNVYDKIFAGRWEEYDPWDASTRVPAVMNNYDGLGACSMFRMFQGWLSMSYTGPHEGTLQVNPLLRLSTSYLLLRPFFRPTKSSTNSEFLSARNWEFCGTDMTSDLQGATPGHGQELSDALHPHLELDRCMVHMPRVKPGDFVVWHCDTIHAVDKVHMGKADSSVLYIPVCPVTELNAKYMKRQRQAFLDGTPGPDFPGGVGESKHTNRCGPEYLKAHTDLEGLRTAGFEKLTPKSSDPIGSRKVTEEANQILEL
ncbi:hypothetical protein BKA67DRAFT_520038 [Truncatella angustata]|uniref:DUF1479-domain-containing protein n=1 Tax=Truncatella angustata TaxID=152316 RepID=A0A9P8ZW70_9PEZI|nr:uncharacterized protein BKA67DRAFT_520038 [Truncatella angustata]KAH6653340.1 hypothetical protein BKA67DRAFT_520038 [Truncatella angustata]